MATGISITERRLRSRASRGFTLIEIMVVVVIVGLMVAGAVLALGSLGTDRSLEQESRRLQALMAYARDQAELQTREFGLRLVPDGYEFVVLDVGLKQSQWRTAGEDDSLRKRTWPGGIQAELDVDGRRVVIKADVSGSEPLPQVMLLSSGEMSSFNVRLHREGNEATAQLRNTAANEIELVAPGTAAKP